MAKRVVAAVVVAFGLPGVASAQPLGAQPLGTAFTYQGRLTDGGNPATGPFDFEFALFDSPVGGVQGGPTLTRDDVAVTNGLFTVSLDFGAEFGSDRRWLRVAVRPGASTSSYTPLDPRQEMTAAPSATFSLVTPWAGVSGKPAGFADDVDNDSGGTITGVTAGTGLTGGGTTGGVSLAVNTSVIQARVGNACAAGSSIRAVAADGTVTCEADDDSGGTITGVTAGTGLTGGGTTGGVSLAVSLARSGSASMVSRSDHDHFAQSWTSTVSGPGLSVANTMATQNGADNVSGVRGTGVYGVLGESASTVGRGVVGRNNSISGVGFGVFGQSSSTIGRGVYGLASGFAGVNYGVYGETNSANGYAGYFAGRVGISAGRAPLGDLHFGQASDSTAMRFGNVAARHHLISNREMVFDTFDTDGVLMGNPIFYWRRNPNQFDENTAPVDLMRLGETGNLTVFGNAAVIGLMSKGGGSFKIDHPLDPENKYLYHSFVESPDMMNVYNGNVTTDGDGYATVELPDWFEALNRDFRYQLTVIDDRDTWAQAKIVREVKDNRFVLRTSVPRTKVSWQVTGIRHDAFAEQHRIPVEEAKAEADRGRYLHPLEHGQPSEKRID
jgi:hypothetical protein